MDISNFLSMSCVMCVKGNFGLFMSFQKVKMSSQTVNQHLQVDVNTLFKYFFAKLQIMMFQAFILCELFHCCDFGGSSNNNLARLPIKAHKSRLENCYNIDCGAFWSTYTLIPKGDFSIENTRFKSCVLMFFTSLFPLIFLSNH